MKRILSFLLALCIVVGVIPASLAAEETATVYLTVSNSGILESDNEGKVMANREVIVEDINEDGKFTYDEALQAAHKAYNSDDGYAGGTYVSKLWGVETSNALFFLNNAGIQGVGADEVETGDRLVASIIKDITYWADWYSFFDASKKNVDVNEEFTLTLKGHLGMAWQPEDMVDIPLPDISIGVWDNGSFTQIESKKTDENGNVSISFSEEGTYYVTADGSGFGYNNQIKDNNATEQSFRALIAYKQSVKTGGAYNIYDFSENELTPARATGNASSVVLPEPTGENITVQMTIKSDAGYWLKNYKVTLGGENAMVYHAFLKACADNNIISEGADSGYISSMTYNNHTLAEFDKGKNSGWLYKVNGELPESGLTGCAISDGDEIVWYYTEDWTKDPSAGHYVGSNIFKPT